MASDIDATKPADGVAASKADMRSNFAAAKAEIEALQAVTENITPYSFSANRNRIINGAMQVNQRFTGSGYASVGGSAVFTVDRWYLYQAVAGATLTASQVSSGKSEYAYALQVAVTVQKALATNDIHMVAQRVETPNWIDMRWGYADALPVTLSFWVNASVAGTYGVGLNSADSAWWYVTQYTVNNPDQWEYKTIIIPPPSASTFVSWTGVGAVAVTFDLGTGSDSYAASLNTWLSGSSPNKRGYGSNVKLVETLNATWKVTGVQLEAGSTATPYEARHIGLDTMLCQRYFYRSRMVWQGYSVTGSTMTQWHPHRGIGTRVAPVVTRFNETPVNIGTLSHTAGNDGVEFQGITTVTGSFKWTFDFNASAEIT